MAELQLYVKGKPPSAFCGCIFSRCHISAKLFSAENLPNVEADVLASSLTTYVTSAKAEYDKELYKEMLLEDNKIDWEGLVGDSAQISASRVTEHHPVPVPSSLEGFRDAIDRVRTVSIRSTFHTIEHCDPTFPGQEATKRETVKKEYILIFTEWASGNNSKREPTLHFFWTVFWPIYGLEKVTIEEPKLYDKLQTQAHTLLNRCHIGIFIGPITIN